MNPAALAGVPAPGLRHEARLLVDERISAFEELFNVELSLGNPRRLVPELRKVVSQYPFHETLHAQLMLALYRSGRQAESLQVYAMIRRKLREDLGIEPGMDLQELHRSVLEQVPAQTVLLPSMSG